MGGRNRLYSVVSSGRANGNRYELKYRKFHLNTRKNLVTVSVVKH